jgi:hypothetical protein
MANLRESVADFAERSLGVRYENLIPLRGRAIYMTD